MLIRIVVVVVVVVLFWGGPRMDGRGAFVRSHVVAYIISPLQEACQGRKENSITLIDSRLNGDDLCHNACRGRGVVVVDYETSPSQQCPQTRQPTLLHELVSRTWHTIDLT